MRVLELWRYPVKSLQGERLASAEIGPEGIAGDRQWALFDVATGFGLTARRVPDLLSLVTTGTLGSWDRRRFRANLVLAGAGEGGLVGSRVRVGDAGLDVGDPIPRCVMVTRPQPGGIARDNEVLKTIHRERGGDLAVAALVQRPGAVRTGDVLAPA
jgi:uncharacterized protein YcbX